MRNAVKKMMFLSIVLFACNSSNTPSNREEISSDDTKRVSNENIVNLGFKDNDLYVAYIGNYIYKNIKYKNIYGFTFTSINDSTEVDTIYYENHERKEGIDFSKCKVTLWPGDVTVKVVDSKGTEHILFNAIESSKYRHTNKGKIYDDLPTISINKDNEYVGDNSINFCLTQKGVDIYEITFKEFSKIFSIEYKLIGEKITRLSFLNRINGNIYSIDKNVYLVPLKEISFMDYH